MKHKSSKVRPYSKYLYALLLLCSAVIIQVLVVYQFQGEQSGSLNTKKNLTLEPDASSALKRAKTDRCRQEIISFAQNKRLNSDHEKTLKRTCPLDSESVERVTRLGCSNQTVPSKNQSLYVTLEESHTLEPESCRSFCFSFNHVYAAYNLESRKCYCADEELVNSIAMRPCDAFTQRQLEWFRVNTGIYRSATRRGDLSNDTATREVRIAFLLSLNGRSVLQIRRLLKNIYSKKHIYHIHVDSRQTYLFEKLKSLPLEHDNIFMSSKRFETIWGGPALLSMMLSAMDDLKTYQWDYLLNLSESDFPLKNLSDLEAYLKSNDLKSIYLKNHNMKGYNFVKKQGLNYDFYQCEGRVWRLGRRHLPSGISYTGGSDWFGLPKLFCDHITENRDNPNSLVSSLLEVFNFTLLPAESFFHTLAQNSEFCDNLVDHNLRITNWHRKQGCKCLHEDVVDWCGCSPLVYRWPDSQRLKQTILNPSLFFSRKFDPTVSSGIIGFVEAHLVNKVKIETKIDTRYWSNIYEHPVDTLMGAYKAFGEFALTRAHNQFTNFSRIASIDLYYKEDRFKGIVYQYCSAQDVCNELMISPKKAEITVKLDNECFGSGLTLKSLEISQDFDASEKLFRNPMPLDSMSDIAVHHVWTTAADNSTSNKESSNGDVQFTWINPRDEIELIQDARIKMSRKPSRLSLVHRLNKKKPVQSGLWKLKISVARRNCMEHQFLVVNETSFIGQSKNREHFDKFYSVFHGCTDEFDSKDMAQKTCQALPEWSLKSRELQTASYLLTRN